MLCLLKKVRCIKSYANNKYILSKYLYKMNVNIFFRLQFLVSKIENDFFFIQAVQHNNNNKKLHRDTQ